LAVCGAAVFCRAAAAQQNNPAAAPGQSFGIAAPRQSEAAAQAPQPSAAPADASAPKDLGARAVVARAVKNYNFKKLANARTLYGVLAFLAVILLARFVFKIKISHVLKAAAVGAAAFFIGLTAEIFYFGLTNNPLYRRFLHRAGPVLFLFWSIFFIWAGNKILNFIQKKYFPAQKHIIYFTLAKAALLALYAGLAFLFLFTGSVKASAVSASVIIGGAAVMFQNTFLNLAAAGYLRREGMLRPGDWIEIPPRGLDGTVVEFKMTSVKVQNWNGTLMFLNAYDLISDSFVNWTKILEHKKRRVKRSLRLDLYSMRQLPRGFSDGLAEKEFFKTAVSKEEFLAALGEGENFSNLRFFTVFCNIYMKKLGALHREETYLLRQMPPDGGGLPLEFYFYIDADGWEDYERGQAEVFEYLISILPFFELKIYQNLSGAALRGI